MENSKFKTLSFDEMSKTQAGWKLFGKETVNGDWKSIQGNYSQRSETTNTYAFGFVTNSTTVYGSDGID